MEDMNTQFAPRLLADKQKQEHLSMCHQVPGEIRNVQNIPSGVITGDETWLHCHNPENKQQSFQWKTQSSVAECPK